MLMLTNLDFLIIIFMGLIALGLISLCLMFLARNRKVKKICFYVVAALALYSAYIGIRIGFLLFPGQVAFGVVAAIAAIAAIVIELRYKEKKFTAASITAAGALVVGVINAIL